MQRPGGVTCEGLLKMFSIVTPTLNCSEHIRRCVGSIRGQKNADFEHIVQDAESTDGTVEWLASQPDLKVRSAPDEGMYDAISRGWSRAKGQFLSWLNADEQYLPGTLEIVKRTFDSMSEFDALFADAIIVDGEGNPLAARREIPLRSFYVKNGFLYSLSCTLFFRRRLWDRGLLTFDTHFKMAGDMDLVLRLLKNNCRFLHIPRYLSLFGVGGMNQSATTAMQSEISKVCARHSGYQSNILRRLALTGRHVEKFLSGCYFPGLISYDYAINDIPEYVSHQLERVGSRFTYRNLANREV